MPKRELFDLNAELLRSTEKAICVSEDGGVTEHWLPKSQIEYHQRSDGTYDITLPLWLASEKGFSGA